MKSDMENEDLINDYEALKQAGNANPFTVPNGYFDDLGDRIVSLKNLYEIKNNDAAAGFSVPENYFEESVSNIQSRIAIEEELNETETDFAVPEGYFESLADRIQSRIAIDEAVGDVAGPFEVPAGYFDKLSANILAKTVDAGKTETIGNRGAVIKRLFASTAFKYASAACFAIALGGGILLTQINNTPDNSHQNSFLHKQLSQVPLDEIKSYLSLNVDAGEAQQTVASQGTSVDESNLKKELQSYVDSIQ